MNACIYMIDRIYIYVYPSHRDPKHIKTLYTLIISQMFHGQLLLFVAALWDAHLGDQQGAHPCAGAAAQGMAELKALKAVAASEGQP